MEIIKKIKKIFRQKEEVKEIDNVERAQRELLRENLNTIAVDIFHLDDPIMKLNPAERREYLLYFHRLAKDKKFIARCHYQINKQATQTLMNSKSGQLDTAGVMKMDGMGTIKDDVERLSNMFLTEEASRVQKMSSADSLRL